MPYITTFERDAKLEIARESVIAVLETRFSALPDPLSQRINSINDLVLLKQLLVSAVTITSVEEFGQMLRETQCHTSPVLSEMPN
ncbi:hypothetical protein ACE1CI_19440 [Aerosakkonemataceae cyanobacterium BLCC-F50]|uniref:Uncharacterized protein n=1 Tax=Floridaenema flaviceps BLCC-F50 TaxID=3153642 RepID=A0ABV4XTS5_9CYAN